MTDPLDQDSFEVESWETLLIHAKATGQTKRYFDKLNKFILDSNYLINKKFDKHISKRVKEITAQEKEDAAKLKK